MENSIQLRFLVKKVQVSPVHRNGEKQVMQYRQLKGLAVSGVGPKKEIWGEWEDIPVVRE